MLFQLRSKSFKVLLVFTKFSNIGMENSLIPARTKDSLTS